ncbi:MFS general substrate transporter [Ascodesmis nigricans]|uniref:MFS general substrate transporter n=1 Tax=Ascodesmis nigricans TaxID=341454 RepID=A0A4S2MU28_9PEZI|nr:MFS general substrate transporter [Ascodesmis nigricans]
MAGIGQPVSAGSAMSAGERSLQRRRMVSLAASTVIALAAGTNYVYSAYAPQLGETLQLSAKEINLIGTFGNLGMYVTGIPSGIIVDKSPRLPIFFGGLCLAAGYYPMHLAMARGYGSMSVPWLCFFSGLTGVGSCCAFGGALKIAALNFPFNRGTATAIALAAFGLSAFFFSTLSSILFPGNSADFLFLLATATSGICCIGYFFCRVVPVSTYSAIPDLNESNRLHRTRSGSSTKSSSRRFSPPGEEIGTPSKSYTFTSVAPAGSSSSSSPPLHSSPIPNTGDHATESSSLFTKSSSESDEDEHRRDVEAAAAARLRRQRYETSAAGENGLTDNHGLRADISGWQLVMSKDFWILFGIMGALSGVGLMTINNIGQNVRSLLAPLDPPPSDKTKSHLQSLQVSLISLSSCISRILSGTLSDHLTTLSRPRHLLFLISSFLALLATSSALIISSPTQLPILSVLTGLSYGALFGVAPTIVSETFGVGRMSTNWGALTMAAVVGGNVGNMWYGAVADWRKGEEGVCYGGKRCYRDAYVLALGMVVGGMGMATWAVRRNWGGTGGTGGRGKG